jgi:hypothetical protein
MKVVVVMVVMVVAVGVMNSIDLVPLNKLLQVFLLVNSCRLHNLSLL